MHTIPSMNVVDPRTLRPLPGPIKVTNLGGDPIPTYDAAGNPAQIVASARGHVADFYVEDEHWVVRLVPSGGQPVARAAIEALLRSADAVTGTELDSRMGEVMPRARGNLPAGNLDDYHGADWAGDWRLLSGTSYQSLPPGMTLPTSVALSIRHGSGQNAGYQSIVTPTEFWWREANIYPAWNPWQRLARADEVAGAVQSQGVGRIVTSTNYEEPLEDGDLLIVLPGRQWFTDFSHLAAGTPPNGWSPRWAGALWNVVASQEGSGDRLLRAENTGAARTALVWDEVPTTADAEMVFRWRSFGAVTGAARPTLRGGGNAGSEAGMYIFHINGGFLTPARLVAGSATTYSNRETVTWEAGRWYITRHRAFGTQWRSKTWPADEPEPDEWDFLGNATWTADPGWVGFQRSVDAARLDVDWIGVALDGGLAPMGRR